MQGGVLSATLLLPTSSVLRRDKSIEEEGGRSANHFGTLFQTPFSICRFFKPIHHAPSRRLLFFNYFELSLSDAS